MTLRGRIFTLLTVFVLIVLSISIFLVVRSRPKNSTPTSPAENAVVPVVNVNQNTTPTNVTVAGNTSPVLTVPTVVTDPILVEKSGVQQLARVFIERYQTYSTDNNYENIKQVETLVTEALWKKLSARLNVRPTGSFVGVTTAGVAVNLLSFGGDKATVRVQTRRETEKGNAARTIANQNYLVELLKVNSRWLVDSFKTE